MKYDCAIVFSRAKIIFQIGSFCMNNVIASPKPCHRSFLNFYNVSLSFCSCLNALFFLLLSLPLLNKELKNIK